MRNIDWKIRKIPTFSPDRLYWQMRVEQQGPPTSPSRPSTAAPSASSSPTRPTQACNPQKILTSLNIFGRGAKLENYSFIVGSKKECLSYLSQYFAYSEVKEIRILETVRIQQILKIKAFLTKIRDIRRQERLSIQKCYFIPWWEKFKILVSLSKCSWNVVFSCQICRDGRHQVPPQHLVQVQPGPSQGRIQDRRFYQNIRKKFLTLNTVN